MRQRHRHRALGHPRQGRSASRSTSFWAGPSATRSRSTPIPTSASSPARRRSSRRSGTIVESGHTALKFDPFPTRGRRADELRARAARRLSRRQHDAAGRARGCRADRADPRNGRPRRRDPDRRARAFRRADCDPALPHAGGAGQDRLVRGAGVRRKATTR